MYINLTAHGNQIYIGRSKLIFDRNFWKFTLDTWQTYGIHVADVDQTVHVDRGSERTVQGTFDKTQTHTRK
jgi:hypothetical protein